MTRGRIAAPRSGAGQAHDARLEVLPRGYLRACLLLLMAERPTHGYDLLARLGELGPHPDAGGVYRILRTLEREGLVESWWGESEAGPARRLYRLTAEGGRLLVGAAGAVADMHQHLYGYLRRYGVLAEEWERADGRRPVRRAG